MAVSVLVLSTSLSPDSKSRRLGRVFEQELAACGATVDRVDLQDYELPFCGGEGCWGHPDVKALRERVVACDAVLVAAPVYNYDVNAAAKNFIELTGSAWTQKVVGMAVAAGGQRSGMAPLGFINSLMLDFRCFVLPRYVYAVDDAYGEDDQPTETTVERVAGLSRELVRITNALIA